MNKQKILVTISGYYERFQINSIESCIKRAKYPERVSFAIAHHEDHKVDTSHIPNRVSRYIVPKGDKTGIHKAKNILATMIKDEDFLLSVDSHIIMMPDWDVEIIKDYEDRIENATNKKIVISGNFGNTTNIGDLLYEDAVDKYFNNDSFFNTKEPNIMNEFIIDRDPNKEILSTDHYHLSLNRVPTLTFGNSGIKELSNIYSGNFSFFPTEWFKNNNFSKEIFFSADQPETSMNIYTSGYDMWMPRFKYHCHMSDHRTNPENVEYVLNGKLVTANRFFDIQKDYDGVSWFLDKINNGYDGHRERSVREWLNFHNLDISLYA